MVMKAAQQSELQAWPGGLEALKVCPACGDSRHADELENVTDLSYAAAPGTWALKRCLTCQAVYLNPRPDERSLLLAYRNYYTHANAVTFKRTLANGYRNRIFNISLRPALAVGAFLVPLLRTTAGRIREEARGLDFTRGAQRRVLDVGCGAGDFLVIARGLGWLSYGVELDPNAVATARERGCEILGSEVNELDARYEQYFDVVTLSHVIEHVRDPTQTLRDCLRLLKPGGQVWIETPNIDSVGYEAYGAHWRGLESPRHLVLFNPAALRSCLERAGFERVEVSPAGQYLTGHMFMVSANMQLGRIAARDLGPLPADARARLKLALRRARNILREHPNRSEYVAAVGYRP
jgi:SAM-dependent methyltransferase